MSGAVGIASGASHHQRRQFEPFSDVKNSGALRAKQALVARRRQKVYVQFPHVCGYNSGTLSGIDKKKNSCFASQKTDILYRLHAAGNIRAMGKRYQARFRPNGRPQQTGVNESLPVTLHP